jgi:hypothetical protein
MPSGELRSGAADRSKQAVQAEIRPHAAALVGGPALPVPVRPHPVQFMVSTVELTEEELMRKGPTYTGGFVGGTIGSFIPSLWGAGQLSLASLVFFMIGGFVGIWIAYRRFV